MKKDPDLQINDSWSDQSDYSAERRRFGSGSRKSLSILLIILVILIFAGGIYYFFSRGPTDNGASPLESKVTALEQKIAALSNQLSELEGKMGTASPDPTLLQQVDILAQKVDALEKQRKAAAEPKTKPSIPSKQAVSAAKETHTVQKGDTLYRISRKYGISVEQLRKLNNLSADQPLRTGQKLLVSPER